MKRFCLNTFHWFDIELYVKIHQWQFLLGTTTTRIYNAMLLRLIGESSKVFEGNLSSAGEIQGKRKTSNSRRVKRIPLPRWAPRPTYHSYVLTSFRSGRQMALCWLEECTTIWVLTQRSNECNLLANLFHPPASQHLTQAKWINCLFFCFYVAVRSLKKKTSSKMCTFCPVLSL